MVRAPDCGSGCRGFESHLPPQTKAGDRGHPGPLFLSTLGRRQVVRQGTLTPSSAGSSPAVPASHFPAVDGVQTIHDPVAQPAEQLPFKQWVRGSNPRRVTSSEIPTTASFPPCGETCAPVGISSLSAPTRSAGLGTEENGDAGCGPRLFQQHRTAQKFHHRFVSALRRNLRSGGNFFAFGPDPLHWARGRGILGYGL